MANKKLKKRRLFLEVDVWRSEFAPVSVTAITDVFMQKFNLSNDEVKKYKFSECVEMLRKFENPDYKEGDMSISNKRKNLFCKTIKQVE